MSSILGHFGLSNSPILPALNTRTLIDLALGRFVPGSKGEWLLDGGIEPLFAITGRSGNFKSTTIDSLIVLLLKIYPVIEVLKYDTEMNAFGVDRFSKLSGDITVEKRIIILNKADKNGEEFINLIREIAKVRIEEKSKKANLVDTPFIMDGQPYKMLIPFIVDIDSFTLMSFPAAEDAIENNAVGSSKTNMYYMKEGNIKTHVMNEFIQLAHKASMYFIFTAQMDDDFQLDPYAPNPKQLQHMNVGDKMKRVGAQFEFLTNALVQNVGVKNLIDSDKECQYPLSTGSSDKELSQLTMRVLRCKKNIAGTDIPLVTSQAQGILPELSNYHYLRTSKWGTIGSDRSPRSAFHPDISLARKEVREKLTSNYELARGMEILAQMKFMEETWTNLPFKIHSLAEQFVEQIAKNSSIKISDILNSRGYWTYDKKDARQYMSVLDIVHLLDKDNTNTTKEKKK
jgi:hypothetical protein